MESDHKPGQESLFALVDGAAAPGQIQTLFERAGIQCLNVYEGLPEAELDAASLFLVPVPDPDADWVTELDRIDRHSPCLSLVWGRVAADQLAVHLRAFLFADIGDGVTAMVRFFDPRNTGIVCRLWGDSILDLFMGPIERWMYRGRHESWQRIENNTLSGAKVCKSITIELEQGDVDALTAHTEPDELLAVLIEAELVDGTHAYFERLADFMPRYERALSWGLLEPTDRLRFCEKTYLLGMEFDSQPQVAQALEARRQSGVGLRAALEAVPSHVWDALADKRSSLS